MKKEFFSCLEQILYEDDIETKFKAFDNFYDDFKKGNFIFNMQAKSLFKQNSQKNLKILHPTRIRRPKQANSTQALAKIIHSITHIEFSAINLALDASYRFKNLPLEFYKDWLEVANEEIKHFKLLTSSLTELGYTYGSFAAHDNLENALKATKNSLAYRMGVVHRGLEAKGLDANPFVVAKLESSNHPIKNLLKEILHIILEDEIKHVSKGDYWWKYAKESEDFIKLCYKFKQFTLTGKKLNVKARLQAGFSEEELKKLENFYSKI